MPKKPVKTPKQLAIENEELRARLDEVEETLRAIRSGEVDALVVSGVDGDQVFTLKGADHAYRVLIEDMSEGALTLTMDRMISYANRAFAEMLKLPLEKVIGSTLDKWVVADSQDRLQSLLRKNESDKRHAEISLAASDGTQVNAYVSVSNLALDEVFSYFCLVVTNLSEQKRRDAAAAAEKMTGMLLAESERARSALLSLLEDEKRAEAKLAASEAELRALFASMLDVVVVIDRAGVYRKIAPTNPGLVYRPPEELLGKNLADVFPPEQAQNFLGVTGRVLETRQTTSVEYALQIGGREYWFSTAISPMTADSTLWVARDITERKQAEEKLQAHAHRQVAVAALGQRALAGVELSQLLDEAVRVVAQRLDVDYCKVLELLPDESALLLRAGVGWKEGLVGTATVSAGKDSQAGYTLVSEEAVIVADLPTETRFSGPPLLLDHGVISGISVIIAGKERPYGVLGAHTTTHRTFAPEDATFLQAVANILANAIERKRAEEALMLSDQLLKRVNALVLAANAEGQITFIGPSVKHILDYEPAELRGERWWQLSRTDPAEREREQKYVARAARGETPVNIKPYERMVLHRDGTPRWILWHDAPGPSGLIVGVGHDITERKQREHELESIAAVSAALRAAPTRTEMLPAILDHLLDLLKAESAVLGLRDSATGEVVIELARGVGAGGTGERIPPGMGIVGHVVATGQPYHSDDVLSDPRIYRPELLGPIRAVVCAPLAPQAQTLGALWVGRQPPFLPSDARLLTAIADIAANALQRETLREQTEQRLQRLSALRAIDLAIGSSLDLRITLNILLDQVIQQLRVDAADILLLKPHTQTLVFAAGRGFHNKPQPTANVHLGQGYAGRAALERRLINVPDLSAEEPNLFRAPWLAQEGFRAYYGLPLIAQGQVEGVLEIIHRTPLRPDNDWLDFLAALGGQAAIAINNAQLFDDLQRSNANLTLAYEATIEGWSRALDLRDKETEGHTLRVTEMTMRLAHETRAFSDEELVHIRRGALLHDIGKMGVPDAILLKPGPLTDEEWTVMREHPGLAYKMLSPIMYLRPALDIPYCHHEKWDGTGYPRGLKGEQIPLAARVFAVVDVVDALRSDRPYRPAWPMEKVRSHIQSLSGTHFDPKAVEDFLKILAEF